MPKIFIVAVEVPLFIFRVELPALLRSSKSPKIFRIYVPELANLNNFPFEFETMKLPFIVGGVVLFICQFIVPA